MDRLPNIFLHGRLTSPCPPETNGCSTRKERDNKEKHESMQAHESEQGHCLIIIIIFIVCETHECIHPWSLITSNKQEDDREDYSLITMSSFDEKIRKGEFRQS